MRMNDKGKVIIHSINELPSDAKGLIRLGAIGGGALVLAVYFSILLLFGVGPNKNDPLFVCCVDFGIIFAWAFALCSQGVYWGRRLMAADCGYVLPTRQQSFAYEASHKPSFSSGDAVHYASSSAYNNHMSINPSSGFPMSGSSGIDTHGNPFGTRSW